MHKHERHVTPYLLYHTRPEAGGRRGRGGGEGTKVRLCRTQHGQGEEFGFHPKYHGKALKDFTQGNDMI